MDSKHEPIPEPIRHEVERALALSGMQTNKVAIPYGTLAYLWKRVNEQ